MNATGVKETSMAALRALQEAEGIAKRAPRDPLACEHRANKALKETTGLFETVNTLALAATIIVKQGEKAKRDSNDDLEESLENALEGITTAMATAVDQMNEIVEDVWDGGE